MGVEGTQDEENPETRNGQTGKGRTEVEKGSSEVVVRALKHVLLRG